MPGSYGGDGFRQHGHTDANDGGTLNIPTAQIQDGAVTAAKLAADAVETAKLKDANVTAAKLAADAVENAKIKDGAVTRAKLATATANVAGSAPASITMNPYSFFPSMTNTGGTTDYRITPMGAGDSDDTGRFDLTTGDRNYVIRWRYITASDDPTIWLAYDPATGEIKVAWVSDDPLPGDKPGIAVAGCTVKKFKAGDLVYLNLPEQAKADATALIEAEGLKPEHHLFRALQLYANDAAPAGWIKDNCRVNPGTGSLELV